ERTVRTERIKTVSYVHRLKRTVGTRTGLESQATKPHPPVHSMNVTVPTSEIGPRDASIAVSFQSDFQMGVSCPSNNAQISHLGMRSEQRGRLGCNESLWRSSWRPSSPRSRSPPWSSPPRPFET